MRDRCLIAIVDDDASVCKALNRLIRSVRMDAETFSSATEFLETGENHEPDCLILDMQMPGMTGLELSRQMVTRKRPIPIIFITAHDDSETRDAAWGSGIEAYLTKPINDQLLLDTIERAMKRSDVRRLK